MSTDDQQKRGGLVPIGDVAVRLPGIEGRGRAMSARAHQDFTLLKQVNQLIEAAEGEPEIGFMARLLALCSLPRTNPRDRLQYVRRNGPYTLVMIAGGENRLPFGNLPRLLLAWVCSEAVRTQSRDLVLGRSLYEFMHKLGMEDRSGGRHGERARLKNQMDRLFTSSVQLVYAADDHKVVVSSFVAERAEFWWNAKRPEAPSLWDSRFCCNFGPATSGWTVFDNDWTGSPIMPSDNPFKWRHFEPGLILLCVRWYLRYAVSYRDLEEMMRERGLCVDHTTIYRWVQRYAPEIDKRCRPFLRRTTDSYRIDETYVRVGGAWHYLYRGVDSNGDTLDFLLRATRDRNAAIAFFRKTVGASHTTPPRVVNVDKNPAYPIAFEAIKHEGFFRPRSSLRQCKYLNNVIEQDHRFIKRRTRPMLGFKQFATAWRTVRGIEMMHALRKGQARWMAKGDVVGQTRLIHKVFGLAV